MREHILPAEPAVGELIWNAGQLSGRVFDRFMRAAGGTRSQFYVFSVLTLQPRASQREIADAVGLEGATVTHHLDAMEADGLVTRTKDPNDRRITRVEMTRSGHERFERLLKASESFDEAVTGFLSAESATVLSTLLAEVIRRGSVLDHDDAARGHVQASPPRG